MRTMQVIKETDMVEVSDMVLRALEFSHPIPLTRSQIVKMIYARHKIVLDYDILDVVLRTFVGAQMISEKEAVITETTSRNVIVYGDLGKRGNFDTSITP